MRFSALGIVTISLLIACSNKDETSPSAPMTQPWFPEDIERIEKALEKELTEEDFEIGKSLLGISMKSLISGGTVNFADYKGKRLIVDFWSSWCIPCIEMFPDIERIKREYEDTAGRVKVLSISVDPIAENARKIIRKKGVSFEVLQAPVSLQEAGILLPFTVFTDENGIVKETTHGKHSYAEIKKKAGM